MYLHAQGDLNHSERDMLEQSTPSEEEVEILHVHLLAIVVVNPSI